MDLAAIWRPVVEVNTEQLASVRLPHDKLLSASESDNASGTQIAFSVYEKDKRVVYMSAPGGVPERLCDGCLRATDWSLDEKALVVQSGDPTQIKILDIVSRQQIP